MGLQIEVKDMKKTKKEDTKTLAFFKVTVSVDGEPLVTLPNYRLVQDGQGLEGGRRNPRGQAQGEGSRWQAGIHQVLLPFQQPQRRGSARSRKVFKSLPVKKGK